MCIDFSLEHIENFKLLKVYLESDEVVPHYSDIDKPTKLTTDYSNYELSEALFQSNRPITCLSRALCKIEKQYAEQYK